MSAIIQQIIEILGPVAGGLAGGALAETGGSLSKTTIERITQQFRSHGSLPVDSDSMRLALENDSDLVRNIADILELDQSVNSKVDNVFNGPITFNDNAKLVAGTNVEHDRRI
jgi:hypothetical protein